jgi:hypothetical protein
VAFSAVRGSNAHARARKKKDAPAKSEFRVRVLFLIRHDSVIPPPDFAPQAQIVLRGYFASQNHMLRA